MGPVRYFECLHGTFSGLMQYGTLNIVMNHYKYLI